MTLDPRAMAMVVAPMLGTAAWVAIGRLEPVEAARVRQQTAQSLPLAAELLAAALAAGSSPVMAWLTEGCARNPASVHLPEPQRRAERG